MIKFCTRHSLSLSIKAGGYGTHGQAVQGDIILDLAPLCDISIEKMNPDGGFTSIKDMPSARNAGKSREVDDSYMQGVSTPQESLIPSAGKRRAEEAFCAVNFSKVDYPNTSSQAAGLPSAPVPDGFEQGRTFFKFQRTDLPSSGIHGSNPHPPAIINYTNPSVLQQIGMGRQKSSGSTSGEESISGSGYRSSHSGSGTSFPSRDRSTTTNATSVDSHTSKSPSRQSSQADLFGYMSTASMTVDLPTRNSPPLQSDPFGYLSDPSAPMPAVPPLPSPDPSSILAPPFAGSSLFSPEGHYMPTRVNPLFPHAYVTFGAGAKQNDIDLYSSSHPLPATSIEGTPCFTPYHVPFSAHPVGASVMVLGGFGFLSRLHGLSIDNLVEVEMVLADGKIVVVNETEHPGILFPIIREENLTRPLP